MPPGAAGRLPGEFEAQRALLLSCAQLVEFHPQVFVDIVAALSGELPVLALTKLPEEERLARRLLRDAGVSSDQVEFLPVAVETMWLRDYGPQFVQMPDGEMAIVDGHYRGTRANPSDNDVPRELAAHLGLPVRSLPLSYEGGNLLGNGNGILLGSHELVERNARTRGYSRGTVDSLLSHEFGMRGVAYLKPLPGEPTKHVDMYSAWLDEALVVIADYPDPVASAQDDLLDRIAAGLSGKPTGRGPLRVARISTPPPPRWAVSELYEHRDGE